MATWHTFGVSRLSYLNEPTRVVELDMESAALMPEGRIKNPLKQHYWFNNGQWWCMDVFGHRWKMPANWKPGNSIVGFVWR